MSYLIFFSLNFHLLKTSKKQYSTLTKVPTNREINTKAKTKPIQETKHKLKENFF